MKNFDQSIDSLYEPSEYLTEVLQAPPGWLLRWGQSLLLFLVFALLALAYLIRFPDRIPAEVVITTPDPVVPVIARSQGRITQILVEENQRVKKEELLAIIQNPADYQDVKALKAALSQQTLNQGPSLPDMSLLERDFALGSLQPKYTAYQKAAIEFLTYQRLNPHFRQQQSIEAQLARYNELIAQKLDQLQTLQRKVLLAQRDYERHQSLHNSQTISDKTLEDKEQVFLTARQEKQNLEG